MFLKFFSKQKPYKEMSTKALGLRFLGEPSGSGLGLLKEELAKLLNAEGNTSKAYLLKIQYPDENCIRVALIIDGREKPEKMAGTIARACQQIASIDLLFFEILTPALIEVVQQNALPFYIADSV